MVEILDRVQPEYILLEATGIAEADALVFEVEERIPRVRLDSVVCIVDTDASIRFPSVGYAGRSQLRAADIVLINKIDLVTEAEIAERRRPDPGVQPGCRDLEDRPLRRGRLRPVRARDREPDPGDPRAREKGGSARSHTPHPRSSTSRGSGKPYPCCPPPYSGRRGSSVSTTGAISSITWRDAPSSRRSLRRGRSWSSSDRRWNRTGKPSKGCSGAAKFDDREIKSRNGNLIKG